jgi:cysteine-rich repeat protein
MANYNAVNYIRNGLKKGIPVSTLKNNLANQGWSFEDITEAVKEASGKLKVTTHFKSPIMIIIIFGLVLIIVLFLIFGSPDFNSAGFKKNINEASGDVLGCQEDWDCDPWSICSDGEKRRTCVDLNDCGTTQYRYPVIRSCYFWSNGGSSTATDNTTANTSTDVTTTTKSDVISCGNNVLDAGEECDDNNTVNGDGCSSVCEVEVPGSVGDDPVVDDSGDCFEGVCSDQEKGDPVVSAVCGNGEIEVGEDCDDGNENETDGCLANCTALLKVVSCPGFSLNKKCQSFFSHISGEGEVEGNAFCLNWCEAYSGIENVDCCGYRHYDRLCYVGNSISPIENIQYGASSCQVSFVPLPTDSRQ